MRNQRESRRQSGTAILTIILAILAVGVIGTGMTAMFGETTVRQAASAFGPKAQYLAESGIRYVQGQVGQMGLNSDPTLNSIIADSLNGRSFALGGGGGSFSLTSQALNPMLVSGNYPAGTTTLTLGTQGGSLPGGLALANTGIKFYDSTVTDFSQATPKAQGRVTTTSPRTTTITLEGPTTAALANGDKAVSNVVPYGIWSVGTAGNGPETASRVIGTAVNTATEYWPPYVIITGPGGSTPDENLWVFGINNPDYGGMEYKGVKLGPTNEVLDPRKNDGELRLNIVARHGGDGWKASIQIEGGVANQDANNVTGQTWYQNDPHYWVPFVFTYNTTDGITADGSYAVSWKLYPSYDEVTGHPDMSNPVVNMSHNIGAPPTGVDRVLGNWYLIAQAPQNPNQHFSGTVTIRNIAKNNVLLPQNYIMIDSNTDQSTALISQNRKAEMFIKLTGEINLNWSGTPAQDYGINLNFYIHDVAH